MKSGNAMKWGLAIAVLGIGALAAGSANAAGDDKDDNGNNGDDNNNNNTRGGGDAPTTEEFDEVGVRHGIRFEGCRHFELVDADATEAWGINNAWEFRQWAFSLDELRANPEPAVLKALGLLFPECPWPPPATTTFGPERVGWADAMATVKTVAADLDLAGGAEPSSAVASSAITQVLELAFRGVAFSGGGGG